MDYFVFDCLTPLVYANILAFFSSNCFLFNSFSGRLNTILGLHCILNIFTYIRTKQRIFTAMHYAFVVMYVAVAGSVTSESHRFSVQPIR